MSRYTAVPAYTYDPTSEMRQASTNLNRRLTRVMYPKRRSYEVARKVPPGRLVTNELIQMQAQMAAGGVPNSKPFRARMLESPKPTIIKAGVLFDGSASQGGVQETVATVRWILTDALQRHHSKLAAVQFDDYGRPVQAPGQKLRKVEVFSATAGWENYVEGFSLIDSALDLIDGDGARLLFIFTDGLFNSSDAARYAEETMAMCKESNVAVLWLDGGAGFARKDAYGHGRVLNIAKKSPLEVAALLGDTIVDHFREVAPQHNLLTV